MVRVKWTICFYSTTATKGYLTRDFIVLVYIKKMQDLTGLAFFC
jgi:hypothetical protein